MADDRSHPYAVTPVEALANLVHGWGVLSNESKRRWPKPGALIEMSPAHVREALQKLTSDDAAKLRFDAWLIDS